MNEIFPKLIQDRPEADIPLDGITTYLSQAETHKILFMQFEENFELPEQADGGQVEIVLEGKISMEKEGQRKGEGCLLVTPLWGALFSTPLRGVSCSLRLSSRGRISSNNKLIPADPFICSDLYYILCSGTFLAVYNFKADALAFRERLESVCLNSGMMDKYILASILFDKTKALCIIKPLYCSFCHCYYSCVMGFPYGPLFQLPECSTLTQAPASWHVMFYLRFFPFFWGCASLQTSGRFL
jgi:hypothetical protein